ncbi:hypothetical protein KAU33_08950 [Candidatus Dependentiae bacterium]|nr:hypothetical protein [Candidatus Dependentiae bacterium]
MEKPKTTRQIVDEYWKRQDKPKTVSEILENFWDREEPGKIAKSHRPTGYRMTRRILEEYQDGLEKPKTISQIVDEYWETHDKPQEPDEPPAVEKPQAVKKPKKPDEPPAVEKPQIAKEPEVAKPGTEFSMLVFKSGRTYHNVTNFKSLSDTSHYYEFDSEWRDGIIHVKIHDFLVIEEGVIKKVEKPSNVKTLAKLCSMVSIYTHSGKREEHNNVRNLTEDKSARIVEFDTDVDVDAWKGHMKMSGEIEKYLEVFEEPNK